MKELAILVVLLLYGVISQSLPFAYNGFQTSNLTLDGAATKTSSGLLMLTNSDSDKNQKGHAFYPIPLTFKNGPNGTVSSFSTTFVFGIQSDYFRGSGQGMAFAIFPSKDLSSAFSREYLGLFSKFNDGNSTNHIFAVELDTVPNDQFSDLNDTHVGININGITSVVSHSAGYYDNSGTKFTALHLNKGKPKQVWIDYDGFTKVINVTLAPFKVEKPKLPLLSLRQDLSDYFLDSMYVGFSSSTGIIATSHYVLGWSFAMNGPAPVLAKLPKLPHKVSTLSRILKVALPVILCCLSVVAMTVYVVWRRKKFEEVLEDWERVYGPHRYRYKDLYTATKGFKVLIGKGGFGRVYRGVLPSKEEIAVKQVLHDSQQGMKQFIAEVVSLGQLRHRNLVSLLGYCRRKGELFLVYEYMPNGSLEKFIYDEPEVTLSWNQRFKVIKGVTSALLYLHEECKQTVIHRDVKASNVLLDRELNGKLGDFGLARLYDHGTELPTTQIVGTKGYMAPEYINRTPAPCTDVFAFGAFLLEVACGRRPVSGGTEGKEAFYLVNWVADLWAAGEIMQARDSNLGTEFVSEEVEMVLKLGLMCQNRESCCRPTMKQVDQLLSGNATELLPLLALPAISRTSDYPFAELYTASIVESKLSVGR